MKDNETFADKAENVDAATEETVTAQSEGTEEAADTSETKEKTYTEDEVNAIIGKRLARNTAKLRKEYEAKYGELESVLRAGTGKEDLEEMTDTFREYYQSKGIQMSPKPTYSNRDLDILAKAEADEIISAGYEEVVEETDRLARIGADKMTARERAVFQTLAAHRQNEEKSRELSKLGVSREVYESEQFKEFASKFNAKTPVTEIYGLYAKMQPKKEIETMGSMTNTGTGETGVKDFYTREEALRFTRSDLDKNPKLVDAIERSITKWK